MCKTVPALKKSFTQLCTSARVTSAQLVSLHAKLGFKLPQPSLKSNLIENISIQLIDSYLAGSSKKISNFPTCLISLDMGVKNMSLSRFTTPIGSNPILQQCIKIDINPKEIQFNPNNYAEITKKFFFKQILEPIDDSVDEITILVERQRFRTGGRSNVLETTLKTNTVEAMLYMGTKMWNELLGKRDKKINILAIPPGNMVKFWLNEGKKMNLFDNSDVLSDTESKKFRIDLASKLLLCGLPQNFTEPIKQDINLDGIDKIFNLDSNIIKSIDINDKSNLKRWKKAWSFKSTSRKFYEVCILINEFNQSKYQIDQSLWGKTKGDDLADSLLHGLAYWKYYQNRKQLYDCILHDKPLHSLLN